MKIPSKKLIAIEYVLLELPNKEMNMLSRFYLLSLLFLFCASTSFAQKSPTVVDKHEVAYKKLIRKQFINDVYIPKDLFDAFAQLDRLMDKETRANFQLLPEERAGRKFYLIMWMVNNWNFYEGSRLSHYIRNIGITHPESMAHFVIVTYHRQLNDKDLNIKERVEFYTKKSEDLKKKRQKILKEETRKRAREE